MIKKRYLLAFGTAGTMPGDFGKPQDEDKMLGMGEDEQWEAFPKDTTVPRAWWRKWLKMK